MANRLKIKFVIFDWDGTLIDSIPKIMGVLALCFREFGLPMPREQEIRGGIGLPLLEACRVFLPGASEQQIVAFDAAYRRHWKSEVLPESPLIEGARQVLDRLAAAGIEMAVATGKGRAGFEREAAHHGVTHYFREWRCAGETKPKPDPEMLEQLLECCGFAKEQALMVGDTGLDLGMARNAKIAGVGVATGHHQMRELWDFEPVACYPSVRGLPGLLGLV